MPKMTLLEMTQNILSAMDSDEVNSINDTIESAQVADTIKDTFYELFEMSLSVPEHFQILKIDGLGDVTKPNYLRIPDNVGQIRWIKYRDSRNLDRFKQLDFYSPEEFFERVLQINANSDNSTLVTDFSGVQFYVKTNQAPSYYTSLDDKHLIFNSYDNVYDTTLQAAKTFVWGSLEQDWQRVDDFIPDIDANLFPLLLAEAKSVCFINIKQMANQKEEQRARRQRIAFQHSKWKNAASRAEDRKGTTYARNVR